MISVAPRARVKNGPASAGYRTKAVSKITVTNIATLPQLLSKLFV